MAGGALYLQKTQELKEYQGRITWHVVWTAIVAGTGGLLFG
jgi:hypothetical protein